MYFSLNSPRNLWDASTHATIIDAFRRRDGEAAAAAMVADIQITGEYLLEQAAAAPTSGPFAPLELIGAAGYAARFSLSRVAEAGPATSPQSPSSPRFAAPSRRGRRSL